MTGGLTPDAKPWLTVITPVYRGERWIEQSLQSLADQCDGGVELIVIDSSPDDATADGSTINDGTWNVTRTSFPDTDTTSAT